MNTPLRNRVAIVTGGSKGYGFGIAKALRAAGAEVWITGRDEKALNLAARRLRVRSFRADVASSSDWDSLFEAVMERSAGLDILVNNAGAGVRIAETTELTDSQIESIIRINLIGHLYGCRRAAIAMKRRKSGIIVNISSVCAIHAWPGWGPYSAAKAGLNQFSKCLYTELRAFGVRVTTITPSWGATDFAASAGLADRHPAAKPKVRARIMQPDEMGRLVVSICSMPDHLEIPDITVQPLVQEIVPM